MSTKSSLKAAFAQQAAASESDRVPIDTLGPAATPRYALAANEIEQPVAVAKALRGLGLSLRKAHDALEKLAEDRRVVVRLAADRQTVTDALAALGVAATPLELPQPRVKDIREALGVSQAEFADRFGLELTTLQNWEQGRNQLDGPARILLAIIDRYPGVVDSVLSAGSAGELVSAHQQD